MNLGLQNTLLLFLWLIDKIYHQCVMYHSVNLYYGEIYVCKSIYNRSPKPASNARTDGSVIDWSQKSDQDGRLKHASNCRANRHPSYPA